MPLPGLKPSIELESDASGHRLVDRATGQSLTLSEMEVQLLAKWDGQAGATGISARVFVDGLDVEPWQVEQFFTRLERAKLLGAPTPSVPDYVPASPGVEQPEDVVPRLRGDLVIAKSAASKGVLEVKDPKTERVFTLYDFEVSIARMLDGRRTAAEVLAAANRLGIPVTLPTLRTFLQQLRAYRFVDDSVPAGGDTTWPRRRAWTPEVRELYQSALRLLRTGKYEEARSYVDAMEAADPDNDEAKALRARIDTEAEGILELQVPFDELHTPVSTAAVAPPPEAAPAPAPGDPFASFGFNSAPPPVESLPSYPPMPAAQFAAAHAGKPLGRLTPAPQPAPDVPAEAEPALAPRSKKPLLVAGAVALLLLVVLLRPAAAVSELPATLELEELGLPRASEAGTVQKPEVPRGAKVEKGAVLAHLTGAAAKQLAEVTAQQQALEGKRAALPPPVDGPDVTKARAALKKAEAAAAPLLKKKKALAAKKTPAAKKQLAALEKKLKPKERAVDTARKALDALTHEAEKAALAKELEALATKKVALQVEAERLTITAPVAGLFFAPEVAPLELQANDAYGRVVGPRFKVVTKEALDGAKEATLVVGEAEHAVTLEGGAARLEVTPALVGSKGTLRVVRGTRPWLLTLF